MSAFSRRHNPLASTPVGSAVRTAPLQGGGLDRVSPGAGNARQRISINSPRLQTKLTTPPDAGRPT